MKAAVLVEKQKMELREFAVPEVNDDTALVKMEACAVCNATDSKLYKGTHAMATYPMIIGHEGVGTVQKVGKNVTKLKVGDRVLAGSFYCDDIPSLWGAYTEYGICGDNVPVVPKSIGPREASLAFMLSEAVNAVRIGEIKAEDNVVVIGAGAVGFSILSVLKNTLHKNVIVIDLLDEKLEIAKKLGADAVINSKNENVEERIREITGGEGVNKVFEAVGSSATYQMAFEIINRRGTIVPFGMVEGIMEIPFRQLYAKEIQMKWCKGAGQNEYENRMLALGLLERGLIETDILITTALPFERVAEAFPKIAAGTEIRVVLEM